MSIDHHRINVRAAVRMGHYTDGGSRTHGFYLETPYIKSWNVKRARGQISATFSATLKVRRDQLAKVRTSMLGNLFEIWAGTVNDSEAELQEQRLPNIFDDSALTNGYIMTLGESDGTGIHKIFTGYALKLTFNPCREDAEFIFLNVSGNDVFYFLQDKRFTRRTKPSQLEMWAAVTGVIRQRADFDVAFTTKLDRDQLTTDKEEIDFSPDPIVAPEMKTTSFTPKETAGGLKATNLGTGETEEEE